MTGQWAWATVTQASPLRIRLDGESTALAVTPTTLVASLLLDDRVRVHLEGTQVIITGRVE